MLPLHYRKDSPQGITPPNPDADGDIVQHITKHRGQKTLYTSVSESPDSIKHFDGILYTTEPDRVVADQHIFIAHAEVVDRLKALNQSSNRAERVLAVRALQLSVRAREALVQWKFSLAKIKRKDRVGWCQKNIQKYFKKA